MHRLWRAAGKVVLVGLMTLVLFGAVAVLGAILGQRASMPAAAPGAATDNTAPDRDGTATTADAAGAGSDDVPAEEPPPGASGDGLELPPATAAEVLAARFPAPDPVPARPFPMAMLIPGLQPDDDRFDPDALSGMATEPQWPGADTAPPAAMTTPADLELQRPEQPAAGTAARRSSARSPYVLNDAMILSIKRRLRLSPDQEKLWLPVEAALRKLMYSRAALNPQHGQGPVPYIDPATSEDLKTAVPPLIGRLNEGQRREVRDIAHVMGLTAMASQL